MPGAAELFRATSAAPQPDGENVSPHSGRVVGQAVEAVYEEAEART